MARIDKARPRQLGDPVVQKLYALLVDDAGSHARHAARADGADAVEARRAIRIARGDDLRTGDVERVLAGAHVDDAHLPDFPGCDDLELGVPATPAAMAVAAVGVEIRAGPQVQVLL